MFIFAIAGDLSHYYRNRDDEKLDYLGDILEVAQSVFEREVYYTSEGGWLFQPGVWSDHPDYLYAGNEEKSPHLEEKRIKGIAEDTSHSHRLPLWLTSLAHAYPIESSQRVYYEELLTGLEHQFLTRVLVKPIDDFPSYRTTNFMDGRDGFYRWNYVTQGPNNGYGPYELSGTLCLGWRTFLDSPEIKQVYADMAASYPLSEDVISVYV